MAHLNGWMEEIPQFLDDGVGQFVAPDKSGLPPRYYVRLLFCARMDLRFDDRKVAAEIARGGERREPLLTGRFTQTEPVTVSGLVATVLHGCRPLHTYIS